MNLINQNSFSIHLGICIEKFDFKQSMLISSMYL